jgi:hypothetical protein
MPHSRTTPAQIATIITSPPSPPPRQPSRSLVACAADAPVPTPPPVMATDVDVSEPVVVVVVVVVPSVDSTFVLVGGDDVGAVVPVASIEGSGGLYEWLHVSHVLLSSLCLYTLDETTKE